MQPEDLIWRKLSSRWEGFLGLVVVQKNIIVSLKPNDVTFNGSSIYTICSESAKEVVDTSDLEVINNLKLF